MRHPLIFLTAATLFAWIYHVPAYAGSPAKAAEVPATTQLPRSVRPSHYDVSITPDTDAMKFSGKVGITVEVVEQTNDITLNAVDMVFSSVSLTDAAGQRTWNASRIEVDTSRQTATFAFDHELGKGRYRLVLDYTGKIATQAAGLFAIDYPMADGQKRALYTKFEDSDARRMIPAWDEPAFKATFTLEVAVPGGQMAVSNMPMASQTNLPDGRSLVRFAPTPKMSTYLLFFGLGEFERIAVAHDGVELGIVTKKGSTGQAAFALESSKAVLKEYNDFFGMKYPLPKLDNVAAPGRSQSFSAMENWGAIFSFEHSILLDPAISSQSDRQRSFQIAAHEIAHQWFGNLVTMRWWDDLWLNEGFASWMAGRTTEKLHPEWNTALDEISRRERAMDQDALETTHPVVQHVETVEQVRQAFDGITYQKGAAVIRMVENYVGPETWRNGVHGYMKKHAYGNTVSDDLWMQIEAAAQRPIKAIAHDFTRQPGVPLIRVESAICANGETTLKLTQGEFSKDRPMKKPLHWRVPVIVRQIGSELSYNTLVRNGAATIKVPGCALVIVNAGQAGYYRTLYRPAHIGQITSNFSALKPIDQIGVLSDTWSLGMGGLQTPAYFLDLIKATPLAADPQVWGKIAAEFATLDRTYSGDPAHRAIFRKFAIGRLAPKLAQVGWIARPDESDTVAILRDQLVETLGTLGDAAVIGEARRRFTARSADASALPGTLRKAVLRVVAVNADTATWDQLHAAALSEKGPMIKDQLYDLLAATEDAGLAQRALDLALTAEPGETIGAAMIRRVALLHPDLAVDYALANIARVNTQLDASSRSRFFPSLARGSFDPAMIVKLNAYAAAYLLPTARRDAKAAVANIEYWIKVRRERLPLIDAWLARNSN
ncbi:MAG: M1 family metallopeptidase [Proteobacteria bacterium]|nr:M1 family metallopeptidase [Pseudomonadota bacterium]